MFTKIEQYQSFISNLIAILAIAIATYYSITTINIAKSQYEEQRKINKINIEKQITEYSKLKGILIKKKENIQTDLNISKEEYREAKKYFNTLKLESMIGKVIYILKTIPDQHILKLNPTMIRKLYKEHEFYYTYSDLKYFSRVIMNLFPNEMNIVNATASPSVLIKNFNEYINGLNRIQDKLIHMRDNNFNFVLQGNIDQKYILELLQKEILGKEQKLNNIQEYIDNITIELYILKSKYSAYRITSEDKK